MKKIILIPFLVLCFQMVFAQSKDNRRLKDREIKRSEFIKKHLKSNRGNYILNTPQTITLHKGGKQTLIEQIDETWDSASQKIINYQKIEFGYDANERKISETYFGWNEPGGIWEKSEKNDYTRDVKGNVILVLNSGWNDISSAWENNYKDDYSYSTDNDMLTDLYSEWDVVKSLWLKISKIEDTYDANHKVLTDTYSEWDAVKSVYAIIDKLEYTYDAKGNQLTDSYSTWNATTSKWLAVDQYVNTFDANNNMLIRLYSDWDNVTRKWVNNSKDVFTYDANNNMLTNVYTVWNATTSLFVNTEKTANFYDSKNNQIQSNDSIWVIRRWVNNFKSESTFDSQVSTGQLILPFDNDFIKLYFKTKLTKTNQFDWNKVSGVWDKKTITTYNYWIDNTSVNKIKNTFNISAYPNPAKGMTTVKVGNYSGKLEINIYDLAGKLVSSKDMEREGFIIVEDLKAGIYLIQFRNGQTLLGNKKLIIE